MFLFSNQLKWNNKICDRNVFIVFNFNINQLLLHDIHFSVLFCIKGFCNTVALNAGLIFSIIRLFSFCEINFFKLPGNNCWVPPSSSSPPFSPFPSLYPRLNMVIIQAGTLPIVCLSVSHESTWLQYGFDPLKNKNRDLL